MMGEADHIAHPWPLTGWIDFRWRKATWCIVRPWYTFHKEVIPLTAVRLLVPITFWFPFLTIRTKHFHCYYGWKPITLEDHGFYWRGLDVVEKWRTEGRLFVQGAARQGIGEVS